MKSILKNYRLYFLPILVSAFAQSSDWQPADPEFEDVKNKLRQQLENWMKTQSDEGRVLPEDRIKG